MRTRFWLLTSVLALSVTGGGAGCTLGGVSPPPKIGEGEGEGEGAGGPTLDLHASLLSAAPLTSLPADGIAAFTVTAHVVDSAGHPMSGVTVTFAASLGTIGAPAATNRDGDAVALLASTATGDATVTARINEDTLESSVVVEFAGCRTAAQAYEQELYPKVFSHCQGCHNELGLSRDFHLSYVLPFPGVDNWAQRSIDVIKPLAQLTLPGTDGTDYPYIVGKPSQRFDAGHEGGLVIPTGSEQDRLLQAFAARLSSPDACVGVDDPADAALSRVELLSPRATFSRAKLALTGSVATPEEIAAMDDTDDALDAKLDALMTTPEFEQRVGEMYADWFLTDRFTQALGGRKIININASYTRRRFFSTEGPGNQQCDPATDDCCSEFFSADYCAGKENLLIDTLAREPLKILEDVVRNDRPISDAMVLDHTFVTPLSALYYGFTDNERAALFDSDLNNDATETAAASLHKTAFNKVGVNSGSADYPHAGVLNTSAMLGRWPSTTSNKNRGRAQSIIMRRLMNIDVMKFAEFSTASLPPDADLELATQQFVACTACHSAVDPIAGFWQKYQGNGVYKVTTPAFNTDNMPEPSFLDETLPDGADPLQFLASRVVQHERFPLAMLMPVLQALCGFTELDNVIDPADPQFQSKSLAIGIQHKVLADLRARFADVDGLRVKALVKDIVKSEMFRAKSVDGASLTDTEKDALALAGVGRGVMITPEQLDRKIASVVGFNYRANRVPTGAKLLLDVNQYRILWGGINYDAISTRFRDPSPVLTRIVERMANELACVAVPQDFATTDKTARHLLTLVEATDTSDALIRAQLKRLHAVLLDEELNDGDAELEASVAFFNDALTQGRALVASGDAASTLRTDCRATKSFDAQQTPYPTTGKIVVTSDPDYIIRAWQATVSYLLSDTRFFTE